MSVQSSSRIYNRLALEVWFEHIAHDWEASFSQDALEWGRAMYRKGEISGIELSEKDAIVHCTFARKDTCYVVLEWDAGKLLVRCSREDKLLGDAVAVGGLYEIEELIAEAIDPLPYEPELKVSLPNKPELPEEKEALSEALVEVTPARQLVPYFSISGSSLRVSASWENSDSGDRPSPPESSSMPVSVEERERLVRLTALAKEAGFTFRRNLSDFVLSDPDSVATFFAVTRKRWESIFGRLDFDPNARHLLEGIQ